MEEKEAHSHIRNGYEVPKAFIETVRMVFDS
jgi:hypothetical protein